jgi:2-hydroxychromene-2-carboxylate isomerase
MHTVVAYTIYHSPNAYLGMWLLRQGVRGLDVTIERRPIFVPRDRGLFVADLVGGRESARSSSYYREDCARWAARFAIPWHPIERDTFFERAKRWATAPFEREELPARAYYAAQASGREDALDEALFNAAWVKSRDVNDEGVVREAATEAGLDADWLLAQAKDELAGCRVHQALEAFDAAGCPGVPTFVVDGARYFGKDRVDWVVDRVRHGTLTPPR